MTCNWVVLKGVLSALIFFAVVSCDSVAFRKQANSPLSGGGVGGDTPYEFDDDDGDGVPDIPDDPVDPGLLPDCELAEELNIPGACLVFIDSFERDEIIGNEFHWKKLVLDSGGTGSNVTAKIHDAAHLGPIYEGNRALLMRGREGYSTHEIYLLSNHLPFDMAEFDFVYIELQYVPIKLDGMVTLNNLLPSGEHRQVPESLRIDVCRRSDCGEDGGSVAKMSNPDHWIESFFKEKGRNNQIRSYSHEAWKKASVLIDLNAVKEFRDTFVFKVTGTMDEGYIGNDPRNRMEDGLIVDHVMVVAIKRAVD